jgi:hypothetical protein
MAYQGYLIKVGNYIIPTDKYVKADSYSVTRIVQDLDSARDANGILHRTALSHVPHKIEFETPAMLTNTDMADLFGNIRRNYLIAEERKLMVTAYIPELDDYVTQKGYMADFKPQMYFADANKIQYDPVRFAFIGGVSSATD